MSRAASVATNLAVTAAVTTIGCMAVITLTPDRTEAGSRPPAGGGRTVTAGHPGSAARAATSALGAPAAPSGAVPFTPPVTGRIEVTAPRAGIGLRSNSSFAVAWKNSTGEKVNVWLRADLGHGFSQRMGLAATRAGAGATGEAIATLPPVPPGRHYFLEVATTGNAAVRGFSRPFTVTG
ncbi:hypothetical protein SSP35_10_01040 [Streptomyces sp. NBRC 110611]|uniref:hypothetical protein n=1 Tax=Streptomyces sp. NBRC 110611 TaxID=1621259 RepID=UPI00085839D4|nr:hypothetical protein [Streptomyces sp. NBRC 110611]GAU69071.1 hypothetical protein SSP35_10_01040 [Streptomyces sp. NBRC 110611]